MRKLLEAYCWVAHRSWWFPLMRRFPLLACPVSYLSHKPWFRDWFWKDTPEEALD